MRQLLHSEVTISRDAPLETGVGILGEIRKPAPPLQVPAQIIADDYTNIVELKALRAVDAADLIQTGRLRRPDRVGMRFRLGPCAFLLPHLRRLAVPRHRPIVDGYIMHKRSIRARL